ncbi:MAG: hypothetical protein ACTS27_01750 [Phycisphaerales bacterium]
MDTFFESLAADPEGPVKAIAVLGMSVIGLAAVVLGIFVRMRNTRERERSRREIAAYVAEGSISPDDAERLLNAAQPVNLRVQR